MSSTAVLNLQRAGFTDSQVEALAAFVDGQSATTADVQQVRADLATTAQELHRRIDQVERRIDQLDAKMEKRFVEIEARIDRSEARSEQRLAETKVEIVRWFLVTFAAFAGIVVGAIKLMMP